MQDDILDALSTAAKGRKAGTSKPMTGLGSGVFEIAIAYKTDAYRTIYALKLEQDIWVIHAFQKKGKKGIKTPKQEIDLIIKRIKVLKESFK